MVKRGFLAKSAQNRYNENNNIGKNEAFGSGERQWK